MRTFIASLLVTAVVSLLAAAGVVYAGLYDIAATTPHWPATSWLLETARTRSITAQAAGIVVPPGLDDPAKVISPVSWRPLTTSCSRNASFCSRKSN